MISNRASKSGRVAFDETQQSWLDDMRAFYARHGFYRTKDIQRVIGAPWESVVIKPSQAGDDPLKDHKKR